MVVFSRMVIEPEDDFDLELTEVLTEVLAVRRRSQSAPPSFDIEVDAAQQRIKITTIVDGPHVVDGTVVPRTYQTEVSSIEDEESPLEPTYQIVRMADGSQFYLPAAPPSPNPLEPSFVFPFPSPLVNESSSWLEARQHSSLNTPNRVEHDRSDDSGAGPQSSLAVSLDHQRSLEGRPAYGGVHQNARYFDDPFDAVIDQYSPSEPGATRYLASPGISYQVARTPDTESYENHSAPMNPPHNGGITNGNASSSTTESASLFAFLNGQYQAQGSFRSSSSLERNHGSWYSSGGNADATMHDVRLASPADEKTMPLPPSLLPVWSSSHLQDTYASGKYSDMQIMLKSASKMFEPMTINAHRVIVSKSPVLKSILQIQETTSELNSAICIKAAEKFSAARAFEYALQRFYGLPLIYKPKLDDSTSERPTWGEDSVHVPIFGDRDMNLALCYGAAGAFLNSSEIVRAAFDLVLESFNWENLETALHFGIFPEDFLLTYDGIKTNKAKTRRTKRGKNKDKINGTELIPVHDNLNAQVIQEWAPKVASAAIRFMVSKLPTEFHFDRTALSKVLKDRIPHHLHTGYSIANLNPNLASLTFGQHPQPSPTCTRASAILLALPFWHFRDAIEVMRQQQVLTGDLIKAILQEREERRACALHEYGTRFSDQEVEGPESSIAELGYQEFAIHVQSHDASWWGIIQDDYTVHRVWKGYQSQEEQWVREPVIRKFDV